MSKIPKNQLELIEPLLVPGAILNFEGQLHWWPPWVIPKALLMSVVYDKIRMVNRFNYPNGNDRDIHTAIWLRDRGFEMTTPKGKFFNIDRLDDTKLSIYHPNEGALGYKITAEFVDDMIYAASQLEGKEYDYGELIDHLLGYKTEAKRITLFRFGSDKRFVCSSTAGLIIEHGRKKTEERLGVDLPRLFQKHVETYIPADYANTPKFTLKYHWTVGVVDDVRQFTENYLGIPAEIALA